MNNIFVGDVGTIILVDCGTDVSSATELNIRVRKPDGLKLSWTAQQSAVANSIQYVLASGDIDQAGDWELQAFVTLPGWSGVGDVVILPVAKPL